MSTTQEPIPFTMQIKIGARSLKAAALGCIQKDNNQPFRYAFHCVALDISAVDVVAIGLDGHKMIAASAGQGLPDVKPQTLLIPRKIIDKIKLGKGNGCTLKIEGFQNEYGTFLASKGLKGTLVYDGMSLNFDFQDEVFCDWRQICHATATGEAGHFNLSILSEVQKAYELCFETKPKGKYIQILHNGNQSTRVLFEGVDAFAVIMPLRLNENHTTPLPDWAVKKSA